MTERRTHISLIAIPDAVISTLGGIYDVLNSLAMVGVFGGSAPAASTISVEIVGETHSPVPLASGVSIQTHRGIDEVASTDIVIVPSLLVTGDRWETGRYPKMIAWLRAMHAQGAMLCSACSGVFLLAETGLFDGNETTVHWAYAIKFRQSFPNVPISPNKALVASGQDQRIVSSGASTSWHDLVLYLVSRLVGPATAQALAHFYALQWHREGLAPYVVFMPSCDHGDAVILEAQDWLATHFAVASPVEEMLARSNLAERTFKRRFTKATSIPPIVYVQHLRIEEAKRQLERGDTPIEQISWQVGYEDSAFFRRLFKRLTGVTPGAYRRTFHLPTAAE